MNRQARYPQAVRERAVRMVLEYHDEHDSQWGAICLIAEKLGVNRGAVRRWLRQAGTDQGQRGAHEQRARAREGARKEEQGAGGAARFSRQLRPSSEPERRQKR